MTMREIGYPVRVLNERNCPNLTFRNVSKMDAGLGMLGGKSDQKSAK